MHHDYDSQRYDDDSILLKPALKWIKGNRSVGESGKVNLVILYRNELDLEKQTITQELYGQNTPKGPSMERDDES